MKLDLNDMLYSLSYALDCVEAEIFGVKPFHSERVAYLCIQIAKAYDLSQEDMLHLTAAAVLHDNALTEYISIRRHQTSRPTDARTNLPAGTLLKGHCDMGERNVQVLPFYDAIRGAVLYHHEHADGSGPFGMTHDQTPLFAQFIHLADTLDNVFDLTDVSDAAHDKIHAYLDSYAGSLFCPSLVEACHRSFPQAIHTLFLDEEARTLIHGEFPVQPREYDDEAIVGLATMFARIVDYKSHFTCTHSLGIAQKASQLGRFYGYDQETCTKLYLAGALHDIGKLTISNDILEKPAGLTADEFTTMKGHALASWNILKRMTGLEEITSWAALHHEKLNGKGYPFGRTAAELNKFERLMGCIDIYQALTESRPYKDGYSHEKALSIMSGMAQKGFIDKDIVTDIDRCFTNNSL